MSELLAWSLLGGAYISLLLATLVRSLWARKHIFIEIIYALLALSLLFMVSGLWSTLYVLTLVIYMLAFCLAVFLSLRVHIGRLPEEFLRQNTLLTTVVISLLFSVILFLAILLPSISPIRFTMIIMAVALCVAVGLSVQTFWALKHYVFDVKTTHVADKALPTVTLAIPARNETLALAMCLDAALQTRYQKLEILVLDDCSHDNTSGLIRSYAHAGVRFIQGEVPASGWLGKTNAYDQLAQEASGDIILFISVDTHLQPESVSQIVTYLQKHQLEMVSILPKLHSPVGVAALLQNLRYVWQIIVPITKRRVPVSSEAWAIRRHTLKALGGFLGVKHKIVPEGSFARRLMKNGQYHFVIANRRLPMEFVKNWRSQQATAIRLLYPTLKRQPLRTLGAIIGLLLVGMGPFVLVLLVRPFTFLWWLAVVTSLLYIGLYMAVLWRTQTWWWLSGWLLPLVLLQEFVLLFVSMALYEFSRVDWKGRNVCYPVLLHKRR